METELDDLHQLSGSIFSNISCITPHLRNLVASAKTYQKSCQATIVTANQFVESIETLAQMAAGAKGATRFIGETLSDIKKMFGEIEEMKQDLMKLFINEVIIPLESKAEQEINMSKLALKQYLQDNKIQTDVVSKATHEIVKIRKKSQRRKAKPGKYETKEEEMLNDLLNSEKKLLSLRQQGLRRALIGERRIYCFIGDRLCSYGRGMSVYSSRISTMLGQLTSEWDKVISRPGELPTESEEIISHPSTYNTATIRKKNKYATINARDVNNVDRIAEETTCAMPVPPPPPPVQTNGAIPVSAKDDECLEKEPIKGIIVENRTQSDKKKVLINEMRFSMVEDSPTQKIKQVAITSKKQLIALYDHMAKDPSQLTFSKGDILRPISEETSGWQFGENTETAKTGWFPAAYVEQILPKTASKPGSQVILAQSSDIRSSPKEERTRRVSTPAQMGAPYIPAPDYDTDEADGPKGAKPLHVSMSAPTIKINGIERSNNERNNNPSPLMPLAAVMKGIEVPNTEDANTSPVMPFPPPPPPEFAEEKSQDLQNVDRIQAIIADNPFASVKLKKTLTNDRSNPRISA